MRLFLGFLVFILAVLTAYPISGFNRTSLINVQKTQGKKYSHTKNSTPIALGANLPIDGAYLRLELRFKLTSFGAFQNLFQTALYNQGLRMEFNGSSAAILFAEKNNDANFKVIQFPDQFKLNTWYSLDVELLNGEGIRVSLDDILITEYQSNSIFSDFSRIIVGVGFDKTRIFKGDIADIFLTVAHLPSSFFKIPAIVFIARFLLVVLLCLSCVFFSWFVAKPNSIPKLIETVSIRKELDDKELSKNIIGMPLGVGLVFILVGLIPCYILSKDYFGLAKWFSYLMLPVSLFVLVVLQRLKIKGNTVSRTVLNIVCSSYFLYIGTKVGARLNVFPLGMLFVCMFFSMQNLEYWFSQKGTQRRGTREWLNCLTLKNYFGETLLLALCWFLVVDLANWSVYITALNRYFGLTIIGSFLVIKGTLHFFKNLTNSRFIKISSLGLFFDFASILCFLYFSFRHDSLFNLTEFGSPMYHWEYFVGVIRSIRNGGFLLFDSPSQYGFLNIFLASLIPVKSSIQAFYIFQGSLLFVTATGLYISLVSFLNASLFNKIFIFIAVFMAIFFADPQFIGPYPFPSSSVMRFFCVYGLVLIICCQQKMSFSHAIGLALMWNLSLFWSCESAFYGSSIYICFLVGMYLTQPASKAQFYWVLKYLVIGISVWTGFFTIISVVYLRKLGSLPDFYALFEHALGYAQGFGYVPFSMVGSGNILFLIFICISVNILFTFRSRELKTKRFLAPLTAMAGCIWSISSYYVVRPVAQNVTALFPIIIMILIFTIGMAKRIVFITGENIAKAILLPMLFLVIIPVFNPKLITVIWKTKSFSKDITRNLSQNQCNEVQQLILNNFQLRNLPVSYYGDDAALPLLEKVLQSMRELQWLPGPFQLYEVPISEVRRKLYFNRFICRNKKPAGILVHKKDSTSGSRLRVVLSELLQYYKNMKAIEGNLYSLYHFDSLTTESCTGKLGQ